MTRLLFDGCMYGLKLLETRFATRYLLGKLNIEFREMASEICCGRPAAFAGDLQGKERLVTLSINEWGRRLGRIDEIIVACPGCGKALEESPEIKKRSIHVTHFAELLPGRMEYLRKSGLEEVNTTVTIHYPCHLNRGMGVGTGVFRAVLDAMKGIEVIEMEDAEACCGGSGGVRASSPEVAREVRSKKVLAALRTGADLLVTSCPMCEEYIALGIQEAVEDESADDDLREVAARMQVVSLPYLVAFGMDDFKQSLERIISEEKKRKEARRVAEEGGRL